MNRFCRVFKPENKDKTKKGNNKPGDKKKANKKETEKDIETIVNNVKIIINASNGVDTTGIPIMSTITLDNEEKQ